jgi:ABC-type phosphate transport system substrate-binding protein
VAPGAGAAPDAGSIAIVVNKQNPAQTLTVGAVRKILLGEVARWPNGSRITVVMREPGQVERDAVLQQVCRMADGEYSRRVLHALFIRELESGPKLLNSAAGVRRFVVNVPGAIGFLRSEDVDDSIKVMALDGPVPSELAFGLRLRTR